MPKEVPYSYLGIDMTWYHVVPINIVHIYLPNNFALPHYSITRGTFSNNLQRGTVMIWKEFLGYQIFLLYLSNTATLVVCELRF